MWSILNLIKILYILENRVNVEDYNLWISKYESTKGTTQHERDTFLINGKD